MVSAGARRPRVPVRRGRAWSRWWRAARVRTASFPQMCTRVGLRRRQAHEEAARDLTVRKPGRDEHHARFGESRASSTHATATVPPRARRSASAWASRVLPAPPTPVMVHQPVPRDARAELGAFSDPPDERRQPGRETGAGRGALWSERGRQVRVAEVIHPFGPLETAELHDVERRERHAGARRVARHGRGGRRDEHLTAGGERSEPRAADDRGAAVRADGTDGRFASMDGHPHPDRSRARPRLARERALRIHGRSERVAGAGEGRDR